MTSPDLPTADLSTTRDDYSESYYRSGLGPPYDASEPHWARFFGAVADQLLSHLPVGSVLDVGCAKGFFVEALLRHGVDAQGVDVSEYAIAEAAEDIRDRVWVQDLTEPLSGRWDLVTCIEVIEHMAPADAQRAIDNITAVTDLVLLSSTPHDFVEATHVNVHPPEDWAEWFAARGFYRRTDVDLSGLSPWAVVFERRPLSAPAVVRLYEAELAPLREEVIAKRYALLEANRRLEQLAAATDQAAVTDQAPAAPPAEDLAALDRVLALTDQVIGLQAELAQARYQHDLIELALASAARSGPSSYETEGGADDLVLHARLTTEIELRQGLARQLAEERSRANTAERELRELRSSPLWRAEHVARSTAQAARKRLH
jgi:SAM-dependent methyltransferase